ncbi:MAG: hypothetical protein ACYDHH_12200 [Solirubrobacteraceae bacterium]
MAGDVVAAPVGKQLQRTDLVDLALVAADQHVEGCGELGALDRLYEPIVSLDHDR